MERQQWTSPSSTPRTGCRWCGWRSCWSTTSPRPRTSCRTRSPRSPGDPDAVKDPSKALAYLRVVGGQHLPLGAAPTAYGAGVLATPRPVAAHARGHRGAGGGAPRGDRGAAHAWRRASARCWCCATGRPERGGDRPDAGHQPGHREVDRQPRAGRPGEGHARPSGEGGAMSTTRHRGARCAPPWPPAPSWSGPRTWRRWPRSSPLRPRWQSPWVLLATAAVVLLVLGVVLQGVGPRPRSDEVAPEPDAAADRAAGRRRPRLEGRRPLDARAPGPRRRRHEGEGRVPRRADQELRRPDPAADHPEQHRRGGVRHRRARHHDRHRPPSNPIDADDDGDQELVLCCDGPDSRTGARRLPARLRPARRPAGARRPSRTPTCWSAGSVPVPGSETEFYDLVRVHDYWIEDGALLLQPLGRRLRPRQHDLFAPRAARGRTPGSGASTTTACCGPATPAAWCRSSTVASRLRAGHVDDLPVPSPGGRPTTSGSGRASTCDERLPVLRAHRGRRRPVPRRRRARGRTHRATALEVPDPRVGTGAAHVDLLRRCVAGRHLRLRPRARPGAGAGRRPHGRAGAGR